MSIPIALQGRMRALGIALGLFGLAAASPQAPTAQAAVLMSLDLPALVEQSDVVVIANAVKQSSRYVDKLIVTDVTLKVIAGLKGTAAPGELLTVTHLGGAVGDVGLRVPGAATFRLGQSAVVFLRRAPGGDLNVTGMSQGVMPISGQGTGQQVESSTHGAALMQRNANGQLVEKEKDAASSPRALSDLIAEIEQLVRTR